MPRNNRAEKAKPDSSESFFSEIGSMRTWIHYGLRPYRAAIMCLFVLFALGGFLGPLENFLFKDLIDALPLAKEKGISILWKHCGILLLFIVATNMIVAIKNYLQTKYQPLIRNHIVEKWMDIVLDQSPEFYKHRLSGKVSAEIVNLSFCIEVLALQWVPSCILVIFNLSSSLIVSYSADKVFFNILMIWAIIFLMIMIPMSKKIATLSNHQALADNSLSGELVDVISNYGVIGLFFRKNHEKQRMGQFFNGTFSAYRALARYQFKMLMVQGFLVTSMIGAALYFLMVLFTQDKNFTIGNFSMVFGVFISSILMVREIANLINKWDSIFGKCKQSLSSLSQIDFIQDQKDGLPLDYAGGHIVLDHVSFHYAGRDPLFQNQSLSIPSGQKVGLVGQSGGGKSTFVNLILRLYDVTGGSISIDGQDIKSVTQESLRKMIALIPQDPGLFHRTILENIRYGRIDATDEEVFEAAKKAYVHETIMRLPQGYQTMVGERGVTLSSGQRQRMAIARAILKNAPILILDEATSQLDSLTEKDIQNSFAHLMEGKTTLVVAHRLATLLHMDRILVFERGKIVQDGTHEVLIGQPGLYQNLWNAQVGGFLPDHGVE